MSLVIQKINNKKIAYEYNVLLVISKYIYFFFFLFNSVQ